MTAGSKRSMNASRTLRCTRIRLRAQQSCPALSKTPYGAVVQAFEGLIRAIDRLVAPSAASFAISRATSV